MGQSANRLLPLKDRRTHDTQIVSWLPTTGLPGFEPWAGADSVLVGVCVFSREGVSGPQTLEGMYAPSHGKHDATFIR